MMSFALKAGLLAGLFFPLSPAWATTFGPIPVYKQVENAQYVVRGRIVGGARTLMAPRIDRPYTYWNLQVNDQLSGDSLGGDLVVREPGGEIDGMGYRVAGTAEFADGEEVFVALHDTDEAPNVKEVVGLASGKYRVQPGKDGKPVVINGLGTLVTGRGGFVFSPSEFTALIRRLSRGEATEADKEVYANRYVSHGPEDEHPLEALAPPPASFSRRPAESPAPAAAPTATDSGLRQVPPNPAASKENSVQESPSPADEASTGFSSWGWMLALAVLAGLILILVLALKR